MSAPQDRLHPQSLKREYDEFLSDDDKVGKASRSLATDPRHQDIYQCSPQEEADYHRSGNPEQSMPTPPTSIGTSKREASPARSSTGSLSDARSTTPSIPENSPEPSGSAIAADLAAHGGISAPPLKKTKLTPMEKEVRRIDKATKERERAEEKARKEAEKEAEKRKKEAEKEEKKAAQEAEKAAREEKRRVKENDRRQKEEEKRQKEEEKRHREEQKQRAEEEKRKKDRSQKKLNSYFVQKSNGYDRTSMSPAPSNPALGVSVASPAPQTPSKSTISHYEQTFPAFFIQNNVEVAPINRFERDEETSINQQRIIDNYILENRSPDRQRSFDAMSLFNLSGHTNRGKQYMTVREIMAEMSSSPSRPIDLTTDSQNSQIKRTGDLLRSISLKFLKFAEDVRPPYRGTYTSRPLYGMRRLARNPLRRDLPDTNYDYDSEAEWIEDEDAEDLNSEGEEDDIEPDDAEDLDGFLDDENDELMTSKRLVLQGDIEPISTGLCWEDQLGKNSNVKMRGFQMEIILDGSPRSIDPFASHYWTPAATKATTMEPPRVPLNTLKSNSLFHGLSSASKPVKPFFGSASPHSKFPVQAPSSGTLAPACKGKEKKLMPKEDWASFKEAVQGSNLSKVGLIEVLKKKFPRATGGMVKATLEAVAQRVGKKESEKRWVVSDGGGMNFLGGPV